MVTDTVGIMALWQVTQAASAALLTRAIMYCIEGVCMCGIQLRACSSAAPVGGARFRSLHYLPGRDLVLAY
jgi:hypothetical protein